MLNDVLPWMIDKTEGFLGDQNSVDNNAESILTAGIVIKAVEHRDTLRKRQERLLQEERDAKRRAKEKEIFRQQRREARIKREKDQKKQQLRDEIFRLFIRPGEVQQPAAAVDLMDSHGNYVKNTTFLGSLGGHVQQLYYVIAVIMDKYETDLTAFFERSREDPVAANKSAETPRELLLERFFLPFMLAFLKDLKSDNINILKRPEMADLIEAFKEKPRGGRRRRKKKEDEEDEGGPSPQDPQEVDLAKLTED